MAYTFLQAINMSMKRVGEIAGDQGELVSFDDSARQPKVDVMRQVWNEALHHLYSTINVPMPKQMSVQNITLALNEREYDLPTDFIEIDWPLINESDGQVINCYVGGWRQMRRDQLQPDTYTGLPYWAVVSPVTGKLRMDRAPTSSEAGRVYVLSYFKRLRLYHTFDAFPFNDMVVDALVPAVAEGYRDDYQNTFNGAKYRKHFAQAARMLGPERQCA